MSQMKYRLALDLGSTSLGWSMIRLNDANEPNAVIKAGVRIFSDGRRCLTRGKSAQRPCHAPTS
jgi:CRISPR/Cas system Type II protein with McrA/HNH and RuvC-like nuclease domain